MSICYYSFVEFSIGFVQFLKRISSCTQYAFVCVIVIVFVLSTAQLWSWQSWRSALSKPNKSQATPTKHYKTLRNSTAILSKSLTWNTLKAVLAGQCCLIEFLASLLLLPEEPTKSQMSLCHIAQSANFQQLSRRHKMNVKHNPCECYSSHKNWSTKHIFLVIIDGGSKPIVSSGPSGGNFDW